MPLIGGNAEIGDGMVVGYSLKCWKWIPRYCVKKNPDNSLPQCALRDASASKNLQRK